MDEEQSAKPAYAKLKNRMHRNRVSNLAEAIVVNLAPAFLQLSEAALVEKAYDIAEEMIAARHSRAIE